jgi:hypothetical protein
MTKEENREQAIQNIAELMRYNDFSFVFKKVKKPKGIRIIYEITEEDFETVFREVAKKL